MRKLLVLVNMFFLFISFNALGQQVRETSFTVGFSKTSSTEFKQRFEEALPAYLTLMGSKSWYANDHRISLIKEAGLNLQYAGYGIDSESLL